MALEDEVEPSNDNLKPQTKEYLIPIVGFVRYLTRMRQAGYERESQVESNASKLVWAHSAMIALPVALAYSLFSYLSR